MNPAPKKSSYPRALPYQAPDDMAAQAEKLRGWTRNLQAQSAQLRRWAYYLVAGAAGVLILSVAAVLFAMYQTGRVTAPAAAVNNTDPAKEAAPLKAAPGVSAKDVKPAASAGTKALAGPTHHEFFLEAMGGLSAAHLYQTYLNIGLLADGVESEAYSVAEAKKNLAVVTNFMDLVEDKLAKVEKVGLEPDDHDSLARIKTVADLLRLQSKALTTYWDGGMPEQAEQYQLARKTAWTGLSKVLGLDS